ncbi:MAG TPA: hypothetical protein GX706_02385 [Candidatus Moranbacteria bacterium]|nr:hypothetical protein [Candidatus Moranbacteria bacterium]
MKKEVAKKEKIVKKNWLNKQTVSFFLFGLGVIMIGFLLFEESASFLTDKFSDNSVIVGEGEGQKKITSKQVAKGLAAVRKFYESQDLASRGMRVDFSTQEGEFRLKMKEREVLNKLVENAMIEILAEQHKIKITEKDLIDEFEKRAMEVGSKEILTREIKSLYGWSKEEFQQDILRSQLQLQALLKSYTSELKEKDSFKKITEVRENLKQDPANFDNLAKQFSEGESAERGGRLGWFKKEQMIAEVAEKAFNMNKDELSEVIISPLGYHIIRIDDVRFTDSVSEDKNEKKQEAAEIKKNELEGGNLANEREMEVEVSQIFIKEDSFAQWLVDQKKNISVKVLAKDYFWNVENLAIEFSDSAMQKREEEICIKSEGDPSV